MVRRNEIVQLNTGSAVKILCGIHVSRAWITYKQVRIALEIAQVRTDTQKLLLLSVSEYKNRHLRIAIVSPYQW